MTNNPDAGRSMRRTCALAGRQLFFAESTGAQKEKLTPKLRHTAEMVLRV